MSAICGIINFDGQSADKLLLERMAASIAHRGPDGVHFFTNRYLGFVHLNLITTPESESENQPLVSTNNNLILVADARIDDRSYLISSLRGRSEFSSQGPADADLILSAYQTWGADCVSHLSGDFAFVICDLKNKSVYMARDRMGCRTLYYRRNNSSLVFASEIPPLLTDPEFKKVLNRELVVKDLILPGYSGKTSTYYQSIKKVPRAHFIQTSPKQHKIINYWKPGFDDQLNYKDKSEYVDHFQDLFRNCVKDRLRCQSIGVFLSSGMDSGSIAAMASDELAKMDPGCKPKLQAMNWTYSKTPILNEYNGSRELAEFWGFDYRELDISQFGLLNSLFDKDHMISDPYSSHMIAPIIGTLNQFDNADRPKVWMHGYTGDFLVDGINLGYYRGLIAEQGVLNSWRIFRQDISQQQIPIGKFITKEIFRRKFYRPFRILVRRMRKGKKANLQPWVMENLIDEFKDIPDWALQEINKLRQWNSFSQFPQEKRKRYWTLSDYHRPVRTREWFASLLGCYGAEHWSPWDDHRLVDFSFNTPEAVITQGLNRKSIVKQALKDLLPMDRYTLTPKMSYGSKCIVRGIQDFGSQLADEVLTDMRSAELGFVSETEVNKYYRQLLSGEIRWRFDLWMPFCLEVWLRNRRL